MPQWYYWAIFLFSMLLVIWYCQQYEGFDIGRKVDKIYKIRGRIARNRITQDEFEKLTDINDPVVYYDLKKLGPGDYSRSAIYSIVRHTVPAR